MVLSNLSVSDVSIYFVWLLALLVVRDELEHLWRAISCCRLNRSPQVSHLNGSFARSATVIHTYIIIIIMVLSNLSVSDVSIYFVWLTALLVMRDELEHLWHTYIHTYIHTFPFPSGLVHISDTGVTRERTVVDGKCWIVVSTIPHGTNSEKPPLYLLPTSAATSHRLANTTDDHR